MHGAAPNLHLRDLRLASTRGMAPRVLAVRHTLAYIPALAFTPRTTRCVELETGLRQMLMGIDIDRDVDVDVVSLSGVESRSA